MGSENAYYGHLFTEDEFDLAVSMHDQSSDDESQEDDGGHPYEGRQKVLENLESGFPYNKGGPAREYQWEPAHIAKMTDMIRRKNENVRKRRKQRPRTIRAQNYRGETSNNYLLNWVNSVRTGKRFEQNQDLERGPKWLHGQKSNHQLWETVSQILTSEFHYWMKIHKQNALLPESERAKVKYPRLEDLIFRVNDDFTGGLWSQFYKYWEPFIDELRYLPLTISFDNFISVTTNRN